MLTFNDPFLSSPELGFSKDKKRNQDRDKFIVWLENPHLLQNAVEAKEAIRYSRRRIKDHSFQGRDGVIASMGVFRWSLQTGSVCQPLTQRALATLIESLTDNVTLANALFAWGFAPKQELEEILNKAKAEMQTVMEVINSSEGQSALADFDDFVAKLPMRQDQRSKNAVAALRMAIEGGRSKIEIAELLTGRRSVYLLNKLVRSGRKEIWHAGLLKVAEVLEIPDEFLSSLGLLSIEEISGSLDNLAFQVCNLVYEEAIDEMVAERIIRLAVEANELLCLIGERAGCPLSIKRGNLSRQKASDYLPEPLGFSINSIAALEWVLQEKMPSDVKLVMLCLAAIGGTGQKLRVATGLPLMRWQIACKSIQERQYLDRLESVAGNKLDPE